MEWQKAEELYEDGWCTSQTTVFSKWMSGEMVLKYTETGNVLERIRFQSQFPNRNVYYCRRPCQNLNHTGHTYCNCPLLFVCTVSSDSETVFKTFWLFPENTGFCMLKKHKYPFIYWEMWSGMCTNHQSCSSSAFCSIRLFQALVSLILKYWNNYRILDYVTLCDHPFVELINREK